MPVLPNLPHIKWSLLHWIATDFVWQWKSTKVTLLTDKTTAYMLYPKLSMSCFQLFLTPANARWFYSIKRFLDHWSLLEEKIYLLYFTFHYWCKYCLFNLDENNPGSLQCMFNPVAGNLVVTDGNSIGLRKDLNGIFLLKTALQPPVESARDGEIVLEMTLPDVRYIDIFSFRIPCQL